MNKITVLIADDQALVRAGLAALLNLEPDLDVVSQVANGQEALDVLATGERVDVALLDIEMPVLNGLETTHMITVRYPTTACLIVTTFERPGYLRAALDNGAKGFLVKDTPAEQLAEAIRRVARGLRVVDPQLAQATLLAGPNALTSRERDVLRAAADGASVRDIAASLCLSPGTVRNHLSSAIGKTATHNRACSRSESVREWVVVITLDIISILLAQIQDQPQSPAGP